MDAYIVTAGYVTVETALPGGGRGFRDVHKGQLLPGDVPAEQVEHELRLGTIEPYAAPVAAPVPPAPSAPAGGGNEPAALQVPDGSVPTMLAWVGDDKDRAAAALAAESAEGGKNRATLITRLEAVIAA